MSSSRQNKSSGIMNLLSSGGNNPKFVPPMLREVSKLAAGVAAVQTATGSATGNPRNKCALQPGHSLMDWIRLGNSGKDLTGVGTQAGRLTITPAELSKHNKITDAWLSIRGKVFNVTMYLPFHPGGPEELMRGAGIDATSLFDQVHSWVNYESILQKCYIGRLTPLSPSINTENLFSISKPKVETPKSQNNVADNKAENLPRFDWIQKTNEITVVFYTSPMENPLVEMRKIDDTIRVIFSYSGRIFTNDFVFFKGIKWPCNGRINYETGKIELVFAKVAPEIWKNFGVLKRNTTISVGFPDVARSRIKVSRKSQVCRDISILELAQDDVIIMIPLGYHIRVFLNSDDDISRSYSPIPQCLMDNNIKLGKFSSRGIFLMIKKYEDGFLSKRICEASIADTLYISKPLGSGFVLSSIEKKEYFLLLAAGTGITPMISIILFLLERRIRKSQSVRLISCNKKIVSNTLQATVRRTFAGRSEISSAIFDIGT